MRKIFNLQKIMIVAYIIVVISCFLYALGFMTDYSDLFGLVLSKNAPIADFHDNVLQPFNRDIFWMGVAGVVSIVLVLILELFSTVPSKFSLICGCIMPIPFIILSIKFIETLKTIEATYLSLNFSYLWLEGYIGEYVVKTITFDIGSIVYTATIIVSIALIAVLLLSHFYYVKKMKVGA